MRYATGEELLAMKMIALRTQDAPDILALARSSAWRANHRALAGELLEYADEDAPVFGTGYARIRAAAESLVGPARAAGELRADLTLDQVLALVASVANISGDPAFKAPVLDAALDGLRPR